MRIEGVWAERVGGVVISLVMSGVMSAVMIGLNTGLVAEFPFLWAKGWLIGFCVSYPAARLVVPPVVRWQLARSRPK